ncbi:MAG: DUF47 domain-containing protein [Tissierellia bacterium]|nr:DUF47 domain-containing protein [Tissierellia bacterium]
MKSNNKTYDYFDAFVELSEYSLKAADLLVETLEDFNTCNVDKNIKKMHDIEHTADLSKHVILNRLAKEFLPPIEREDIVNLSENIDEVTDSIEDVLLNINVFNVRIIPSEILYFANIIRKCCKSMIEALEEFQHFKKSKNLHSLIVEINDLEEEADELYVNGLKKLFSNQSDPVKLIIWKDILNSLEKCCDACEHVANTIENIVMKNS